MFFWALARAAAESKSTAIWRNCIVMVKQIRDLKAFYSIDSSQTKIQGNLSIGIALFSGEK